MLAARNGSPTQTLPRLCEANSFVTDRKNGRAKVFAAGKERQHRGTKCSGQTCLCPTQREVQPKGGISSAIPLPRLDLVLPCPMACPPASAFRVSTRSPQPRCATTFGDRQRPSPLRSAALTERASNVLSHPTPNLARHPSLLAAVSVLSLSNAVSSSAAEENAARAVQG